VSMMMLLLLPDTTLRLSADVVVLTPEQKQPTETRRAEERTAKIHGELVIARPLDEPSGRPGGTEDKCPKTNIPSPTQGPVP